MRNIFISLTTAIFFLFPSAQAAEYLRESIAKDYDENLQEMFLHFHRNPELSNLESKTAKRPVASFTLFQSRTWTKYQIRYRGDSDISDDLVRGLVSIPGDAGSGIIQIDRSTPEKQVNSKRFTRSMTQINFMPPELFKIKVRFVCFVQQVMNRFLTWSPNQ